jgi:hypothetical protein
MVEVAQTRELFSALISRPALDDRLLQRPPFKFIHDIVVETIHATGYLSSLFDADELDSRKAGLTKETKIAFIRKLVDALNAEGDLDDVSPAKIVAGKEADRTNLLLQKLAIQVRLKKLLLKYSYRLLPATLIVRQNNRETRREIVLLVKRRPILNQILPHHEKNSVTKKKKK